MSTFLQQLINGVSLGAIYSLIALGYTMVYGVLKLINFAHGDVYMVGAFMGFYLANGLGAPGAQMLGMNPEGFVARGVGSRGMAARRDKPGEAQGLQLAGTDLRIGGVHG